MKSNAKKDQAAIARGASKTTSKSKASPKAKAPKGATAKSTPKMPSSKPNKAPKPTASSPALSKSTKTPAPKKVAAKLSSAKSKELSPTPKKSPAPKASVTTLFHPYDPYPLRAGEEYMDNAQLSHFRAILDHWKRSLMEEVDHTLTEMKEASVTFLADPNDRATQEETFNLELRTRDRERKLIRKIEEALKRIDVKEYGYCESCGIEIGIRRLEARPTAVLCIDCKTLDEIRERRTAQ